MENIPTISVIVPVYNTEKYLNQCIDSILAQTFTDFELLLIDDGSTDNSAMICDEYAQKDSRVRVFHKKNGGVSSARNLGLDNARGEWIAFVDGDDYISSNFCEILLDNENEDLVICSFEAFGTINDKCKINDSCISKEQLTLNLNEYLLKNHFMTPWGKLFKKNILDYSKLRFSLNIDSTEDTIFIYKYMLYIKTIRTKSNIIYYYRHTGNGLSCHTLSIDKGIYTMYILCNVINSLEKAYKTNLSYTYYQVVNYIYIRIIRFIKNDSYNFIQRMSLIKRIHLQLPPNFLKDYCPPTVGIRGKIFYMLARKRCYFLLSLYSYFLNL